LEVLTDIHAGPLGAHVATFKLMSLVVKRYFWFGMTRDVESFVQSCLLCQEKRGDFDQFGEMQPIIASQRGMLVSTDACGPFQMSSSGNLYVLTYTDHFSRAIKLAASPSVEAVEFARSLVRDVVPYWGCPVKLLSDRGSGYTADLYRALSQVLKIRKLYTTAYKPSTNGKSERINFFLKEALSKLVNEFGNDWDKWLFVIEWAYNITVNPSTGYSPFFLMFGWEPVLPQDVASGLAQLYPQVGGDSIAEVVQRMVDVREVMQEVVVDKAHESSAKQSVRYDQARGNPSVAFQKGSLVLVYKYPKVKSVKLVRPWMGPFEVVEVVSSNLYRLKRVATGNLLKDLISVRRLKKFYPADMSDVELEDPVEVSSSGDRVSSDVVVSSEVDVQVDVPHGAVESVESSTEAVAEDKKDPVVMKKKNRRRGVSVGVPTSVNSGNRVVHGSSLQDLAVEEF
jgi:hypothetical protein